MAMTLEEAKSIQPGEQIMAYGFTYTVTAVQVKPSRVHIDLERNGSVTWAGETMLNALDFVQPSVSDSNQLEQPKVAPVKRPKTRKG